jgi:type I site-specific restriction endonuclease
MEKIAIGILTALIISFISSWITVQLSLRRFRTERWWEKKAEAYSKIIEALHNANAVSSAYMGALEESTQLTEDRKKALSIRNQAAVEEILKAMDVGAFLLSKEALGCLKQYQKGVAIASGQTSWDDYLEKDQAAIEDCLRDMIVIAKKDLEVTS